MDWVYSLVDVVALDRADNLLAAGKYIECNSRLAISTG
ncbi:hypothetical protein O59_002090 [Cellvibrio sp. BR]|nr:hypothetical protein O59_002090 [Cellvibrio sp. BR]